MGRDSAAGTFTEISRLKQKGLLGVVQPSQVYGGSGKRKIATAVKWKVRAIEFGESQLSLRHPVKDFVLNITSSKSGKVKGSYLLAARSFCAIVRVPFLPPLVTTAAAPYGTGSTAGGSGSGNRKAATLPMMCLLNDKCEGVALREHASDTVKLDNWYRSIVEALVGLDKYVQLPVLDNGKHELTVHVTPYNVSVTPREPIATLCTRDHQTWQTSAVDMTICPDSSVLCISPRYGPPIVYKLQEGSCGTSAVATVQKVLRLAVDCSAGQQLAPPPISPSGSMYDSPRQPAALPPFVRSASSEPMSSASQQSAAAQLTVAIAPPACATLQRSQPRPPPSLPTESGGSSCGSIGSSSGSSIGSSSSGAAAGGAAIAAAPSQHLSPRPLPRKSRDAAETIGSGPPPDSEAPSVGGGPSASAGFSPSADAGAGEPREFISPRPSPRVGHVASWGMGVVGSPATCQASFANMVDSRQDGHDDCPPAAGFPFPRLRFSDDPAGRVATPCDGSPLPAPRRTHAAAPSCGPNDKVALEAPRSGEVDGEVAAAAYAPAVQPKSDASQVRCRLVHLASLQQSSDDSSDSENSDGGDDVGCRLELLHLAGPGTLHCVAAASTERYQVFESGGDPDVDIYQSYDEGPNESLYANLHELYSLYVNAPDDRLKPALPPRRQRPGDGDDDCCGTAARVPPPPLPLRKGMRPNIAATLDRIIDRIPPSAGCDPFGLKSHVRRDFCWQLALKDSVTGSWQDLAARAIELTTEEIGMIEKFSKDYRFPPPEIVLHHWQYLHFVKCNDMLHCQPTRDNLVGILLDLGRDDLVEFLNCNR